MFAKLVQRKALGHQNILFFVLFLVSLALVLGPVYSGRASSFITVNYPYDDKIGNDDNCSLREAIIAANKDKKSGGPPNECIAGNGADTIILPAGHYTLSRTDNGKEDSANTGDLDILDDLTIIGAGADVTFIDGNGITDRIFHTISGQVTISGVTITDGNPPSGADSGGIFNSTNLTLIDVVIAANHAPESGGGIFNASGAALTMSGSTVMENTAVSGSGITNNGNLSITNSTISGNNGDGLLNNGTADLNFVTIADNGVSNNGTLNINHTIIAGRCTGSLASGGYNLIQTFGGCTLTGDSTSIVGQDPQLEPLANNGGPTPTHALSVASPAVEAGDNTTCPDTDQRGVSRPRGLSCDIGAFELEDPPQKGPLSVNTADDLDDGRCGYDHCSLREAINAANSNPDTTPISFNIPDGNTILLSSPLPTITEPVTLDGTTQSEGYIILQPGPDFSGGDGLTISGGSSSITGLHILNFDGSGIVLSGEGGNAISSNTIAFNSGDGIRILDVTGNTISDNDIHDNAGLSVDLEGDGRTHNDANDPDTGANFWQNFPVLTSAIPTGSSLTVNGRINSAANTDYTLEFFASESCNLFGGGSQTYLGSTVMTTDETGDVYFQAAGLTAVPTGYFVNSTATAPDGSTSEYSDCIVVGADNTSWPKAMPLSVAGDLTPTAVDQFLETPGISRWYKFAVEPNSKIIVTLTDLPANYDLTIYKDIGAAFTGLNTPQDLFQLGAEFAPDAFSPDAFSPDAFSPDAFSPDAFSPDAFSPDAFSPDAFSPDAFSPDAFSPDAFSPDAFSPDAFSPDAFSPDAFSPDAFSPDAFSSAQMSSLLGVSAFRGQASEGIIVNSWNNSGFFYVRVRGANGVSNAQLPFHLQVMTLSGSCGSVAPITTASTHTAVAGDYQTIILTDFDRLVGSASEKADLQARLATFAARPEVGGVIVDVGNDARVAAANIQADAHLSCPYAKNLVAGTIRGIVDAYQALNPLAYVMIIGGDDVVPFFRYPDNALLANENNYVPPVRDASASQASLRLGYILGQDAYGSITDISSKNSTLPIPKLPVGRLVETAVDATTMLDAYLATSGGQIALTTPPLVTGYDFLEDAALAVQSELEAGLGTTADTLIADRNLSPADPAAWTADDLRTSLLDSRHDITFLAGHFSANSALAADYTTRLTAGELIASSVDLRNALIFSAGCHAGYNIVDNDGIPFVTRQPDWGQAFAQKGATLIAGTGYQYGDTDFIEYSERLYLEFSRQLRTGSGPVTIGDALVAAKQKYLADTAQLRGIHEKALIEATLFGFPMMSLDMPGARLTDTGDTSVVGGTTPAASNPGSSLGLATADITVTPLFSEHTVELTSVADPATPVTAFYLSGSDGVVSSPVEPTLPLEQVNVSVPGNVLRGVGFRGGSYTDLADILPLSGAPTTEVRGVHAPFQTDVFYPVQMWRTNYFAALADPAAGTTRLAITPAQFLSDIDGTPDGTLRRFDSLNFRLYFNNNVGTFANNSIPALAAPPTIAQVTAVPDTNTVHFTMKVIGNPASGVQEVWVTYTAVNGPFAGQWQSLDLNQNSSDTTLWQGDLDLAGTNSLDVRYMVQAANGVGLVSLATNLGAYYIPGITATGGQPTELTFTAPPSTGAYGSQATFTAVLTNEGQPVANQPVAIGLGPQTRLAQTNASGEATVTLSLLGIPGDYNAKASFTGSSDYAASTTGAPFTITKQDTVLLLEQPASGFAEDDALLTANLSDANGRVLGEKTVFFIISGPGGAVSEAVITDYTGLAVLGNLTTLPPGTYTVNVYFSGSVPLHTAETATYLDERYNPIQTSGTLELLNHIPVTQDDLYMVDEDNTLIVSSASGVLNNDSDGDNDPLTASLTAQASNGQVTLHSDGSFTYVPNANFNGIDSFSYAASDGRDSSTATVTIIVNAVNDAPTAADDSYSLDQNTSLTLPAPGVLGNDGDVDGDGLTAVPNTPPHHGNLTLNPDGSFTYIPFPGFYGLDSFTYRASDGGLSSDAATVTLTVNFVNTPPVCSNAHASVDSIWPTNKEFYPVTILGVTDADGQPLTITITSIFQDERVGKGSSSPDGYGVGTDTAYVRAERDGKGNGRVYHIYFTADDGMGGLCSGEVLVPIVPHDQSGDVAAIDDGPLYDSTIPD